ncbi:hypothetical protein ABCR94_14585 [Streptomyces sp. 21So2-11]|uniref:hypothetical protein n=1 Tax=Streptomyces sp. 21So2-11 TaxID=3144408 RepID=UPI00321B6D16
MTPNLAKQDNRSHERGDMAGQARRRRPGELGSLEVWSRSAPIRLAGYEDDLAEPHILPGID